MARKPNHRLVFTHARGQISGTCVCGHVHGKLETEEVGIVKQKQHRLDSGARW